MWVENPTAILVIHGMGDQNPLDTLDDFASTLLPVMDEETKEDGFTLEKHHRLLSRKTWNENYISVTPRGQKAPSVDIYEYYWANEAERQINAGEVFDWLIKVGMLARQYYEKDQALADYYEGNGDKFFGRKSLLSSKKMFKKYWYLKYSGPLFRLFSYLLSLIPSFLDRLAPWAARPLKSIASMLGRFIGNKIAKSFGDVVLYTTTDKKSRYYAVRQKILTGAVEKVRQLLTQIEPVEYGSIILVGHSLGSVIAYDTLNRINHDLNVGAIKLKRTTGKEVSSKELGGKFKGLVTFGSPLDKIAFFLRARASEERHIKEQIQTNFHSFRAKHWNPGYEPPEKLILKNDIRSLIDDMVWLNFWDVKDPIAGPLDFYLVDYKLDAKGNKIDIILDNGTRGAPDFDGNIQLMLNEKTPWEAHTAYWKCVWMHKKVFNQVVL